MLITEGFFCEFEVGDKVFLKVAPNHFGLKFGKSRKLSLRFCGMFENLTRIDKVAYELKLQEDWKIHNIFHVGLLRKYGLFLTIFYMIFPKFL